MGCSDKHAPHAVRDGARMPAQALNTLHHDHPFAPSSLPTSNCRLRPSTAWKSVLQQHRKTAPRLPVSSLPAAPLEAPRSSLLLWDTCFCDLMSPASKTSHSTGAMLLRAHTRARIADTMYARHVLPNVPRTRPASSAMFQAPCEAPCCRTTLL
jgi:hypothetical protein